MVWGFCRASHGLLKGLIRVYLVLFWRYIFFLRVGSGLCRVLSGFVRDLGLVSGLFGLDLGWYLGLF